MKTIATTMSGGPSARRVASSSRTTPISAMTMSWMIGAPTRSASAACMNAGYIAAMTIKAAMTQS